MTKRRDSRGAMVASAIDSMRVRGVAGTSFAEVLADSGAPRGSIYHHFPHGKSQLMTEATEVASRQLVSGITRVLGAVDTVSALRHLVGLWRDGLEVSDYAAGCPIVAAGLGNEAAAKRVAADTFIEWRRLIAFKLEQDGASQERAHSVSCTVVGALEGALILSQAQRDSEPLELVLGELEFLCRAATSA